MTTLSIHLKVAEYAKFRSAFDQNDAIRRKFGQTGYSLFRSASDPLELTVHIQWPSMEQAKAWATSPDLKAGLQNAGVVSQPDVAFLEAL
jgi:heme-degrading monooxygenase HmoA